MLRGVLACLFFMTALTLEAAEIGEKKSVVTVADPVGASDFLKVFLGLAIIVAAIFFLAWMVKRVGYINTQMHGALKVIGGLSLTQRERLVLVQVGNKQLLLGVSPGRISTLHELAENIETSGPHNTSSESFAEKLQQLMRGNRS